MTLTFYIIIIELDLHCSYNSGCQFWHLDMYYICNICPVRPAAYLIVCAWCCRGVQSDLMTTLSIYPIRQINVSRVFHYAEASRLHQLLSSPPVSLCLFAFIRCTRQRAGLELWIPGWVRWMREVTSILMHLEKSNKYLKILLRDFW